MVTTTVEKLSPTRVKLNITVTPEELKPSIEHAYKHIAEQVNIPGFRKGKVPPPIIDQRVGRAEVLNHAVSEGLERYYREAAAAEQLKPLGRPEADVTTWPSEKDFTGDLEFTVEVDVRPEFEVPKYDGLKVEVETAKVGPDEVEAELENLRSRFGTLVTVDRPAKKGDFAQLDLVATIGGEEIDTASNISYEIGSGELIEGIDEALDTLTAGESTTFESELVGGDHQGEKAQIAVTLQSVKERELPEADDDFAQIASQFDTIGELRKDIKEQLEKSAEFGQAAAARDKLVELLVEKADIPVPQGLIDAEVHRHLENENRLEDDVHRAEVAEESEKVFRRQLLLDAIVEAEEVKVSQNELTGYLVQASAQYGMEPAEFIQALSQSGQIPSMVGEVARSKAIAVALSKAKVVDEKGKAVDVSALTTAVLGDGSDDSEIIEETDLTGVEHEHDDHEGHSH
ncbi:trigger factor [Protaetiibacter intestinalis]|uniref:Trigger factor n=1 Tax=Protaetiibacter intestinalis TaxID=2419774 RepID=A0A387B7A3_9MICO|nr:trigger factor [Protaetiibacter intestinalis]AYF96999.1 trigger factor [Protaetiibacter intestinalis]